MVHISLDRSKKDALNWAKSFNAPWPTMLPEDTNQKALVDPYNVRAVPSYILVDSEGKEIARGKAAVLAAAKNAQP